MADPIVCETCRRATHKLTEPTNIDAAFAELLAAGWDHRAKKGRGREGWGWVCASCKPRSKPETMGLTTGHMIKTKRPGW
jgi:hypothetical protein